MCTGGGAYDLVATSAKTGMRLHESYPYGGVARQHCNSRATELGTQTRMWIARRADDGEALHPNPHVPQHFEPCRAAIQKVGCIARAV